MLDYGQIEFPTDSRSKVNEVVGRVHQNNSALSDNKIETNDTNTDLQNAQFNVDLGLRITIGL